MRLIDATKIEQFILNNCSDTEEINTIYGELINAPTIEERKEGRWIDDAYIDEAYDIKGVKTWGTKAKCSECGFSKIFIERHSGQYEFCPRCGASMERRMV